MSGRGWTRGLAFACVAVALLAPAVPALAQVPDSLAAAGVEGLIVGLEDRAGAADAVDAVADGAVEAIAEDTLTVPVDDPSRALAVLEDTDGVAWVEPDWPVQAEAAPDDTSFGQLWGLDNTGQFGGTPGADIDLLAAWDLLDAADDGADEEVVVGILDTGIDSTHPDLSAQMWHNSGQLTGCPAGTFGYDWVADACSSGNTDANSHGTHVAGTVAAEVGNARGVAGVARRAKLLDLRFLAANGSGSTSDAVQAIYTAVALSQAGAEHQGPQRLVGWRRLLPGPGGRPRGGSGAGDHLRGGSGQRRDRRRPGPALPVQLHRRERGLRPGDHRVRHPRLVQQLGRGQRRHRGRRAGDDPVDGPR